MVTLRPHLTLHSRPAPPGRSRSATRADWWNELLWVPAAALAGFAVTGVFAWGFELSRSWFVAIYAPVVFALAAAYVYVNQIDVRTTLLQRWRWGVGIGVVFAALLILSIQRQDASARPEGWDLAFDILWLGVVYGAADALLLNILPVMATWRVLGRRGWTQSTRGKVGVGALALVASLIVTVAYHAGFPEYQGVDMRQPMTGNVINTLAFLLANNPIASFISHIVMHIAAVFHGAETTVQLPPHY